MSKTKIIILSLKELIYTAIFIGLGLLLILILLIMFHPSGKKDEKVPVQQSEALYHPGIYTTQISLGDSLLNLEVVVDADHINSVRFLNLEESVATMYPLVEPALNEISEQLSAGTAITDIAVSAENQYTWQLLLDAVDETLAKAYISPN